MWQHIIEYGLGAVLTVSCGFYMWFDAHDTSIEDVAAGRDN